LKIVALNVIAVWLSFSTKVAVPNEAGLGAPPTRVGLVGGFSWELVRFAVKTMAASPRGPTTRRITSPRNDAASCRRVSMALPGCVPSGPCLTSVRYRAAGYNRPDRRGGPE